MKNKKKKLSLKKMEITQLNTINGGLNGPFPRTGPDIRTHEKFGCGVQTQLMDCRRTLGQLTCEPLCMITTLE